MGCAGLAALPESLGALSALQELDMHGCSGLIALPESLGALPWLQTLGIALCSALETLPDSLGKLSRLQDLHLQGCTRLSALPESMGALSALQHLDLLGCAGLAALPESVGGAVCVACAQHGQLQRAGCAAEVLGEAVQIEPFVFAGLHQPDRAACVVEGAASFRIAHMGVGGTQRAGC